MIASTLLRHGSGPGWSDTLNDLETRLAGRSAAELFRLNPLTLAAEWGRDEGQVVDAFLAGVVEGWFDLRWDFHCPHCGGVYHHADRLGASHSGGECGACKVGVTNELDGTVEVTFSASPKLAEFAPGEQDGLLMQWNQNFAGPNKAKQVRPLTGLDLLHRPLFHENFRDDVLSPDETLEIRNVVFLFTDIKGSTRLYEQLGDAKAYALVRDHFKVLFEAVEAHHGIVVKTIGDAVMASFRKPVDALEAALDVHEAIEALKIPGTEEAVVVKMGLHSGPAIAVNLNDRFDYFGQTVNKAARIQGLAHDQEIYFSEVVFHDAACRTSLASRKAAVRRWRTKLKGIAGDQVVYSVK